MLRRIAQHSYTLKAYGWVAIWVGLLGAVVSFCPWVLLNFTETPAFTPLSWSPDGSRLALGAREEFHTVGIYVIDANGENLHNGQPN